MLLADRLKALSDETRLRILNLLLHNSALKVSDIMAILEEPQSKISRHLAYLKLCGWVEDRRVDRWVYYRLASQVSPAWKQALQEAFAEQLEFQHDLTRAREL